MYSRVPKPAIAKSAVAVSVCVVLFAYWVAAKATPSPLVATPVVEAKVAFSSGPNPALEGVNAYAVFDVETGEILASYHLDTAYPIASLTKLFTAAATLREPSLSALAVIAQADVAADGRAGKLQTGETYTVRELLFPLLLESSNDAAMALERTEGTTFMERMRGIAHDYQAASVTLVDPSGISSENVASARDLVHVTTGLYHDEPFIFDITRLDEYIGPYTGWVNNNPVHDQPGYRGGKHGYTEAAGRTLVALFNEQLDGGERTLGYVVLGSSNMKADVATLRTYVQAQAQIE